MRTKNPPGGDNSRVRAYAATVVVLIGLGTGCGGQERPAAADPEGCPAEIAPTESMDVSWAPRSSRLAFSTVERGIFVIDARNCAVKQVTHGRFHFTPDWSPDERQIVFDRTLAPGSRSDLLISDLDGGEARVLTHGSLDQFPSWSPRGDQIAFTRRADIYVVQPNGRGLRRLTSAGYNVEPDWSPDGTAIAWTCEDAVGDFPAICTMDADGSHKRRVFEPSTGGAFGGPAWSPDGRSIAFDGVSSYDPPPTLMIGSAQGGRIRTFPLLSPHADSTPTWSPNGDQIAFVGDAGTWENLYVVRPDETGLRALTESS
jgi:Tol biopolymer transport system component